MMIRNPALDRFRGIGAVCVVLLHAPPFYYSRLPVLRALGWGLRDICQCAVPFFFLLSGWLMASKWVAGRSDWKELSKSIFRLVNLYLPWFGFYLILDLVAGLPHGWLEVVRRLVGFSDDRLETRGFHLWFLPCLLLAQFVSWATFRWFRTLLPALIGGGLLYALLAWMDLRSIPLPWGLAPHEGLNLSLPCVALGAWLGFQGHEVPRIPGRIVAVSVVLLLLEGLLTDRITGSEFSIHPFQIMRVVLPALLLLWLSSRPDILGKGRIGRIADTLGEHSTAIYLAHLAFLALVPFDRLVPNGFVRGNFVVWPVAILGSILASVVLKKAPWERVRKLVA